MAIKKMIARLGLIGVCMLASTAAFAAEDGEHNEGLPQLDFTTWPTQIFWLVVSFSIAYLLMWRVISPRISSVLDDRHTRLNDDITRAKQASKEAAEMRRSFESRLEEARGAASQKTREAVAEAGAEAEQKDAEVGQKIATQISTAEAEIAEARRGALAELDEVASTSAIEAVVRLTGIKITKAQAKKAVQTAFVNGGG